MSSMLTRRILAHIADRHNRAGYIAGAGGVAGLAVALAPFRTHLELTSIGFLFLAAVALVAARWGRGPGLAASALANVCFNFFFVPPRHRFTVQEPSNAIALVVFLLVAVLTSALLARARTGEAAARRHVDELSILHDLARLVITEVELPATLAGICDQVRRIFDAQSCSVWLPERDGLTRAADTDEVGRADLSQDEAQAAAEALRTGASTMLGGGPGRRSPRIVGRTGREAPVLFVPMRAAGRTVGLLRVTGRLRTHQFTDDDTRLLELFAGEVALAVERDRLLHDAARAEALVQTDRLKSALLSAVSHDLRTPLASIKASVSSLLADDVAWDRGTEREFLSAIDEETDRLTRLVANLLDISRIEGGALRPEIDNYDTAELLETVAARLSRALTDHRLFLEVAPDTGDAPLDYVQIAQVVTNLVENAAKFSPPGTTITIAARRDGDAVAISVSDQGPGIPVAERSRVFDKFYRVAGAARRPGTCLGLAICKGLVEAHGGSIAIDEAPGGGARVIIRLPAPRAVVEPSAPPAENRRHERRSHVRPRQR